MIQISINKEIIDAHSRFIEEVGLKESLESLEEEYRDNPFVEIIIFLINNLDKIVVGEIEELKEQQDKFLNLIFNSRDFIGFMHNVSNYPVDLLKDFEKIYKAISELFLETYRNFTSKKYNEKWGNYKYLSSLNQHVCPYCNANYIHTVQAKYKLKNGSGSRAMADLDHFIPKSVYPIFAISIYNLIPSCIYCNQRFKRSYLTDFDSFFSPFEKDVEECFKFEFVYDSKEYKNVFQRRADIQQQIVRENKKHYLELLSELNSDLSYDWYLKTSTRTLSIITKKMQDIEHNWLAIKDIQLPSVSDQIDGIIEIIKQKFEDFKQKVSDFGEKSEINILEEDVDIYVENLTIILGEINRKYDEYKNINNRIGNISELSKSIKNNIDYAAKFLGKVHLAFSNSDSKIIEEQEQEQEQEQEDNQETLDFVKICLGQSLNYNLQIEANTEDPIKKMKVYNNIALFQLEEVYNEFKPIINRRIQQSIILNKLYLQQLKEQFPKLLTENLSESIFNQTSSIMVGNQVGQEVLGKLTKELIIPGLKEDFMKEN